MAALTTKNRQWADTTAISLRARLRCSPCCPCRTSPDAPPDGRGVSIDGRALPRRARTNPGHANLTLALRADCHAGCFPVAAQEMLSAKPPPCRIPKGTLGIGSPPAPRATTRPPARFIEDNIVLCGHRLRRCHADCCPPSPAARHRPWRGSPRASLQASGPPAARCRRGVKNGVAKPPTPAHPRLLAPFHPQGVCARNRVCDCH
jgi:hypothetical protein